MPKVYVTEISKCNSPKMLSYATNGEKFYVIEDDNNRKVVDLGKLSSTNSTITYISEDTIIKNINCKKAIIVSKVDGGGEELINVWYSPLFKIKLDCFDDFFKDLQGLPISISFIEHSRVSFIDVKPFCNFLIDTFYITKNSQIDTIENKNLYVKIEESEKVNKMMELLLPTNKKYIIPKGEPVTKEITGADGTSITMTQYNPFKEGEKLANFKALTYEGTEKTLDSYKGKIIVIDFWFTKCLPCINEMPILNKVMKSNKDKSVSFLSITYNSTDEITKFLKNNKFDFEKIVDAQNLIDQYGVSSYPVTIIIDKAQIIRFIKLGEFENEKELQKEIDKLL
ncbi:MAG TPA: TlpA disulfide reductase family protein [Chitinophagaceae bacterium]|nr:TlpA disulfide reductase family protein [Chitinophagaceae bacterium]